MARTLLGEIAHQIFYTPPKKKKHDSGKHCERPKKTVRDYAYEKAIHKLKLAAFENKKAYEIAKLRAKSKGWI